MSRLKTLTPMKGIYGTFCLMLIPLFSFTQDHTLWSALLHKHVKGYGAIDFEGFKEDEEALNKYVAILQDNYPQENWSLNAQKAYWINAYHAFLIKLIISHLPLESPENIKTESKSIWQHQFIKLDGKLLSLHHIHHNIIRGFQDPRMHFALSSLTNSAPTLRNSAYHPTAIDLALDQATAAFINDNRKNKLSHFNAQISPFFQWFYYDFVHSSSLIDFINKYAEIPLDDDAYLSYMKYDNGLKQVHTQRVQIDENEIITRDFQGIGAEWDSRAYPDFRVTEEEYRLIESRIAYMKMPLMRIMMIANWCYKGNGEYDFETKEMQYLYRHLEVCQKNGVEVILTDWGIKGWLKLADVSTLRDAKHSEIISTYLDYLINKKKFTCIKYFMLVNEPNLHYNYEDWKQGLVQVKEALAHKKLSPTVKIMGSDAVTHMDWHAKSAKELNQVINAYDIHYYAPDEMVKAGKLLDYFKAYADTLSAYAPNTPLLIGEAGMLDGIKAPSGNLNISSSSYGLFMTDYVAQTLQAGFSGVLAWMLCDNSHQDFFWGLWANKHEQFKLRPWFYPYALMSRYLPKGSTIYSISPIDQAVRMIVAKTPNPQSGDWSIFIVNRGKQAVKIKLDMPVTSKRFHQYEFSQSKQLVNAYGFPVPVRTSKLDFSSETLLVEGEEVLCLTTME